MSSRSARQHGRCGKVSGETGAESGDDKELENNAERGREDLHGVVGGVRVGSDVQTDIASRLSREG